MMCISLLVKSSPLTLDRDPQWFPAVVLPHFSWLRPKLCCYKSPDSPFVVISHPHLVNSTSLLSEIAIFVGQIPILPCWLKSISILLAEPPNFCWISTHHSGFYYIGNSTFWSLKSLFFVLFVKVQVAWSPTFECLESRFLGWYPQCSLTAYFSCLKSHFDRFDQVINLWLRFCSLKSQAFLWFPSFWMVKHGKTLHFSQGLTSPFDRAEVWSGLTARSMPRHGVARPASRGGGHGTLGMVNSMAISGT